MLKLGTNKLELDRKLRLQICFYANIPSDKSTSETRSHLATNLDVTVAHSVSQTEYKECKYMYVESWIELEIYVHVKSLLHRALLLSISWSQCVLCYQLQRTILAIFVTFDLPATFDVSFVTCDLLKSTQKSLGWSCQLSLKPIVRRNSPFTQAN